MKKLERNEMKRLKGGFYWQDDSSVHSCDWVMTGLNGYPGSQSCDYRVTCYRNNGTSFDQNYCYTTCQPECGHTMGCSFTHYYSPAP